MRSAACSWMFGLASRCTEASRAEMPLRWISFSRVSMQRAAVLTAVSAASSDSQASTLERVSRSYAGLIRRQLNPPLERTAELLDYLRKQRLWKRYGSLKQASTWPEGARIEQQ